MFNRIKIRRIGGLVRGIYLIFLKLFLNLIYRVYQGIILHKVEVLYIASREYYIKYFNIGVRGVAMLLRLKVLVYYIEIRVLSFSLKYSPDYHVKVLSLLIGFNV